MEVRNAPKSVNEAVELIPTKNDSETNDLLHAAATVNTEQLIKLKRK